MDHDSGMGTGGLMIHVEGGQREGLEEDGIRLHRPGFFHFFGFQVERQQVHLLYAMATCLNDAPVDDVDEGFEYIRRI